MEESEKKEITDFRNFYRLLSNHKKSQFRNKVMDACGFSLATFYYKLTHENFKKLEIKCINEVMAESKDLLK